jgi:hypothetical protein
MSVATKIAALFAALTQEELDALPPAVRRRFADACRHWADKAEPQPSPPKEGVLARLHDGERAL